MRLLALLIISCCLSICYAILMSDDGTPVTDKKTKRMVYKAIRKAVRHQNKASNHEHHFAVYKLAPISQEKNDSGILLSTEVTLMMTNCSNDGSNTDKGLHHCKPHGAGEAIHCKVSVFVQASNDQEHRVMDMQCDKGEIKLHCEADHILLHDDHNIGNSSHFADFAKEHKKNYKPDELEKRKKVFQKNMECAFVAQHSDRGTAQYGATHLADITPAEFKQKYLSSLVPTASDFPKNGPTARMNLANADLPTEYDWRNFGAVTAVKDQGGCGSCWAFSVTGNIEGQMAIKYKILRPLSEQNILDCDKRNGGCGGGWPQNAMEEIIRFPGLNCEDEYKYESGSTGTTYACRRNAQRICSYISNWTMVSKDENEMAAFLYKNGPLSIALNANLFQFLKGGIADPVGSTCSTVPNHAVLFVGYGVDSASGKKYWIMKNSWSAGWGDHGYMKLIRGTNACGLTSNTVSAVV